MNENSDVGFGWLGSGFATLTSFLQTNEIAQYITFGLGILSALITMAYTIYKWAKKAKADQKITQDEIDELLNIISEGADDISQAAAVKPAVPKIEEPREAAPSDAPTPRIEEQILRRE